MPEPTTHGPQTPGDHHHGLALPVARAAHGRSLSGRLSVERPLAPARDGRGLALRRSKADGRPKPTAGPRVRFQVYPTIAEALRRGDRSLAVDGVLVIGEHGDYPINEKGQILYPRYEFFEQVVDGFREGRPQRAGVQRQASFVQLRQGQPRWSRPRSGWAFRCWPARACRSRGGCPTSSCRWIARSTRR